MTKIFGIITWENGAEEIDLNGKDITWEETHLDRDGWPMTVTVHGKEYEGKRYIIRTDRDGWPEAVER